MGKGMMHVNESCYSVQPFLDSWAKCVFVIGQVMVANCLKAASELAARVASAKREHVAADLNALEEHLEQKEEMLKTVKYGIEAANTLKVPLPIPAPAMLYWSTWIRRRGLLNVADLGGLRV